MRRLFACMVAVALSVATYAQEEPEYRLELGAGAGTAVYIGDFNSHSLKGMQPWGAVIVKYHLNPRMALGLDIATTKIKGSSDDVKTWYPIERYAFSHQLTETCVRFEYNFWSYGNGQEYRGSKRLAPFITTGMGITHHSGENSGMTMSLLLGAGVKYKIGQRMNLTAEWGVRFSTNDKLDGRSDVYGIRSSGPFKNTDGYSVLQLALTYDLWAKCKTCNNDRY